MLSSTYLVERPAAAGSPRALAAGSFPVAGAAAVQGRDWTAMSIVIPATKRHLTNPARWPDEEAVP